MRHVTGLISYVAILGAARNIDDRCRILDDSRITCRCIGNEEFLLPDGFNYENVTSLRVASCTSVNLHFSSLTEAKRITEITVQNISERLIFELFLTSTRIDRLYLGNIRRIPVITHDTFLNLRRIESFRIEEARIDRFEERFTNITINDFALINVTVERANGWHLSEKGNGSIRVLDTEFKNVTGSMNLGYFSQVEIVRSKFYLQKPGHLLLEGDQVRVNDSVFSNASVNVVATGSVTIDSSCADGKSSMRLSSGAINSANNRLPTEIVYSHTKNRRPVLQEEPFVISNNTVCIAGNCKCPRTSGQDSVTVILSVAFRCFLLILCLFTSLTRL